MKLRKLACLRLLCFAPLLAPLACSTSTNNHDGGTSTSGGTSTGGTGGGNFAISTLVPDAGANSQAIAIAVASDDRIGVAYFRRIDCADGSDDCPERTIPNVPDYQVEYFEIVNGQASAETTVQVVQLAFGISVAFQPNGKAAVAYLGFNGASYTQSGADGGMYDGTTPAWFQNDAVISYQQSDGTWQQQTVMQAAAEAPVGNIPGAGGLDDNGNILGFWPALTFDSSKAYLAFRDGHFGNYTCPNPQDWCSGTIRFGEGAPAAWTKSWAVAGDVGATSHEAFGGHNQMLIFDGQPALVFDQMPGGAGEVSTGGSNVMFAMRQSDGTTWTQPKKLFTSGNTQSGPSMAYDSQVGLGVAAVDAYLSSSKLVYMTSADGITWSSPDPVVNAGTDGWFPSLAFDTVLHTPHIAYYHCSNTAGINVPGNCPPSQDELQIAHLDPSDNWSTETVDTAGGYLPKIGFLSSGKRFVVYRASTADSSIKFALEN